MLYEVSATPKPGLVDRVNNGAHNDMNFFTFMSSAAAIRNIFDDFTVIGLYLKHSKPEQVLEALQTRGKRAEKAMFDATNGVNTHKGMIFSLGLLCGAAGWIYNGSELSIDSICDAVSAICFGLTERIAGSLQYKTVLTKGECMYVKYGLSGARGEAESGFATVRKIAFPAFSQLMDRGVSVNDALVQTLLILISCTVDTNIVSRHNPETAEYAKTYARMALDNGGIFSPQGREAIQCMDKNFIQRRISPGGSADLLAVCYFLYQIAGRQGENPKKTVNSSQGSV
jgi:triphosphoribosyl-dephospho-CoA synthase